MGTSFTRFRGHGFCARDQFVAAWMANLVREIDRLPELTREQRAFRDDLILQASLEITGAVSDCLHHIERSDNLVKWATEIGNRSWQEYVRWGQYIDGDWLNGLMQAQGAVDPERRYPAEPIPSDLYLAYGRNWLRLLTGDFVPLPLNPSGKFHATGEIEVDVVTLGKRSTT